MNTTNNNGKGKKDPGQIVMATVTYKDGRKEDITGARFMELLEHVSSLRLDRNAPDEPSEKEILEMFAEMLRVAIDFEVTPDGAPKEWDTDGKTRKNLQIILDHVSKILDNYEEWERRTKAGEIPQADNITKFLRGEIEYMLAPRPRGYNELLKINSTGEGGNQYREAENKIKITFSNRLAIEEQKIRQACEFALLDKSYYGAKKNLPTRVTVPIDEIMKVLGRPNNPENKKKFKRQLSPKGKGKEGILDDIKNSYIEIKAQKKKGGDGGDWIRINIGQACGIVNDHIYFQFSEDYARYINTGIVKPYYKEIMNLGSRQFPLPYYVAQKISDQYFYYANQTRGANDTLQVKTLLDHCKEVIDYDYILETDPTHWKSKIKAKYERALNEIQAAGVFKWEYCGKSLKEIPQAEINAADFYKWSELYIAFQLIPDEPPEQAQRLKNRQDRIDAANEKKKLEDAKIIVEADKIKKRKRRKTSTKEKGKVVALKEEEEQPTNTPKKQA